MNVSAEHSHDRIEIHYSTSTSLMNASVQNNQFVRIYIFYSLYNYHVILSNNGKELNLLKSHNITVIQANVYRNNNHEISHSLSNNINITNGTLSSIVVYSTASLQFFIVNSQR